MHIYTRQNEQLHILNKPSELFSPGTQVHGFLVATVSSGSNHIVLCKHCVCGRPAELLLDIIIIQLPIIPCKTDFNVFLKDVLAARITRITFADCAVAGHLTHEASVFVELFPSMQHQCFLRFLLALLMRLRKCFQIFSTAITCQTEEGRRTT